MRCERRDGRISPDQSDRQCSVEVHLEEVAELDRLEGVEPEGDVGLLPISIRNLNSPDDPAVIHHLYAHPITVGKRVKNYFPAFTGNAKRSLRNGHG